MHWYRLCDREQVKHNVTFNNVASAGHSFIRSVGENWGGVPATIVYISPTPRAQYCAITVIFPIKISHVLYNRQLNSICSQ